MSDADPAAAYEGLQSAGIRGPAGLLLDPGAKGLRQEVFTRRVHSRPIHHNSDGNSINNLESG